MTTVAMKVSRRTVSIHALLSCPFLVKPETIQQEVYLPTGSLSIIQRVATFLISDERNWFMWANINGCNISVALAFPGL